MQNEYKGKDRRKYRRVLFTPDRLVEGVVVFASSEKEVSFKISDISLGGLRFMLKRGAAGQIKIGDTCFLRRIQGHLNVQFDEPPEIEIKWIMDEATFRFIMLGCEFKNLAQSAADLLERMVNAEIARISV